MVFFYVALLLLWTAWVVQAWLSAWQVRKFAGRFDHFARSGLGKNRPRAAVVVPFKGVDADLPAAVEALCRQVYADYSLLLVVESVDDPAYPILRREVARYPDCRAEILVAGVAGFDEGQKVHNQIFAIDRLLARADEPGAPAVWVFADSDAVPGRLWLGDLTGALFSNDSNRIGLTTGYRWLVPAEPGATHSSRLASVLNSSVACFFGQTRFDHAWGGSMALRAQTARQGDLRGVLAGALCDDYQFSRMVRGMGLKIYFVRDCLVASPIKLDWPGLVNFAHRQYLLTRVYAPRLFAGALALLTLYVAGAATAWPALLLGWPLGAPAWFTGAAGGALVLVFLANHVRAGQRARVVAKAFRPEIAAALAPTLRLDRWATTWWMAVHWTLVLRSAFGRTMLWRGIYYRLYAPQKCRRLNRG